MKGGRMVSFFSGLIKNRMFSFFLGLTIISALAAILTLLLSGGFWSFVGIIFVLWAIYIRHCARRIENDPLQIGAVTFLGTFQDETLGPGWHLFPGNSLFWNFIPLDPTKVTTTLKIKASTPDTVSLDMEVNLVYELDQKNYRKFLESGGKDRVAAILEDTIHERVREWSTSAQEGPQTWKEARQAREDAIAVIVKALLGDSIGVVDTELPTTALLKYFDHPQKLPFPSKIKTSEFMLWGENWEKLEAAILQRTPEEQEILRKNVEARRKIIKDLMRGVGKQQDVSLGINILKIGFGDIKPPAKIEEAANLESIEEMKKVADENIRSRIEKMTALGATFSEARDMIQVQPGTVKKEIKENKEVKTFTIDPSTIKGLGEILGPVVAGWLNKKSSEEVFAGTLEKAIEKIGEK